MESTAHPDSILIVDFGSQVTQLIARRVREAGVFCEIVPFQSAEEGFRRLKPKAVILSGGPASVTGMGTPRAPERVFELGVPVLGICYGEQTMVAQLGGRVEAAEEREFGRAQFTAREASPLFDGVWETGTEDQVWMSHGDRVIEIPEGFKVIGTSANAPFAAIADESRRFYGVQFHPEVVHTLRGAEMLKNFTHKIAGCAGNWSMAEFRETEIKRVRDQVGDGRVICGLSGGVDSSVVAVLLHEAIGDQLTCVFVDTGMMRMGEAEEVVTLFRDHYNIKLVHVDAQKLFLDKLEGVTDPEQKRKIIGATFIDVFEEEARKAGGADFLAQADNEGGGETETPSPEPTPEMPVPEVMEEPTSDPVPPVAAAEITPVRQIGDVNYKPGSVTEGLVTDYSDLVNGKIKMPA
mgnify:CR=1 FL=1